MTSNGWLLAQQILRRGGVHCVLGHHRRRLELLRQGEFGLVAGIKGGHVGWGKGDVLDPQVFQRDVRCAGLRGTRPSWSGSLT